MKKRNLFILLGTAFVAFILYDIFAPHRDSRFVTDLTTAMNQAKEAKPVLLSNVMPGEWDTVCTVGETGTPSWYIKQHLNLPAEQELDVAGGDFVGDDSWAMAFYFPKSNQVIVKKGYSSIISPYAHAKCVEGRDSIYISSDKNGRLEFLKI